MEKNNNRWRLKYPWEEDDDDEEDTGFGGPVEDTGTAIDLTVSGLKKAVESGEITFEEAKDELRSYYPKTEWPDYESPFTGGVEAPNGWGGSKEYYDAHQLSFDSEGCYHEPSLRTTGEIGLEDTGRKIGW